MKNLICKIFGHNYRYTYGSCKCKRCATRWKLALNPKYDGTNLKDEWFYVWVEDK